MIDFHSHVLPGIDDGSKNVEMTAEMLRMEQNQGVTTIVATPHFYAQRETVQHFLDKRERAWNKVQEQILSKGNMPDMRIGAEVYYFPGMGKAEDMENLCIDNSNIMLLEMPFAQWHHHMLKDVKRLIKNQELTIILAHVERFYPFQKNKDVWNEMLELPVYLQMNGEAFFSWRSKRFAMHRLREEHEILLGSDCHNLTSRVPDLQEARGVISKKLGTEPLNRIDATGKRLLDI